MTEEERLERHRRYCAKYRAAHPDRVRASSERWRKSHMDNDRKRSAKYRAAHLEKARASQRSRYHANKEKMRAQSATYRAAHSDKIKAYNAFYIAAHPDYHPAWNATHRPEKASYSAKRQAIELATSVGDLKAITAIYRQARENKRVRCYLCREFIPLGQRHVDHIVPLAKGGEHRPSNLAIACGKCNIHKGAKLPEEVGVLL